MEYTKKSNKGMMLVIGQWPLGIHQWLGCLLLATNFCACSVSRQIGKTANDILLKDTAISTGHIGISIYEPAINKYWYNYNADKYFIPASNTKLFTLYAGMKYLGDSLVGVTYENFNDKAINIISNGDPTFLHPDFKNQPVLNFLKSLNKQMFLSGYYKGNPLGYGWAWDDYNDNYMVERNAFPIHGNIVKLSLSGYEFIGPKASRPNWNIAPRYFTKYIDNEFLLDYLSMATIKDSNIAIKKTQSFIIKRERVTNKLNMIQGNSLFKSVEIPFVTNGIETAIEILQNDFQLKVQNGRLFEAGFSPYIPHFLKIKSHPSDSLFKPMMHRSDNFFAEQTLLMASNEYLGYMTDEKIIDTLLKTDLKDIPQKPKWVDGSGLSRYNLFTPQSLVYILNKTKNEFGWERLKNILPTGGTGTLSSYYKKDSGFIYAKTGTLSNNCALSGVLFTRKGKLLIFSVLANHYITGAAPVRRSVEKFLLAIRENY